MDEILATDIIKEADGNFYKKEISIGEIAFIIGIKVNNNQ